MFPVIRRIPVVAVKQTLHKITPGSFFIVLWLFSGFQTTGLSFSLQNDGSFGVSPYIESIKYNTTVFVGQTAYLPCVVKHLGDKTVSWIRRRDLHILTSGNHIYTSDPRVSLVREGKLLNSWTLKIVSVLKKDEGSYECQVNTEPKMTATLHLVVFGSDDDESHSGGGIAMGMLDSPQLQLDSNLDPKSQGYEAKILGPLHQELEEGKIANFTCLISHGGPPPNVTWFLNDIPVQKTSTIRGGINIETEKSPFTTISKLVIVKVDRADEGKYSCGGPAVYPASLTLRILQSSEKPKESILLKKMIDLKRKIAKLESEKKELQDKLQCSDQALLKLFSENQVRMLKNNLTKTVWRSEEISKCIELRCLSSKAFDLLRDVWKLPLPSKGTILRTVSQIDFQPGLLMPVLNMLKKNFAEVEFRNRQCMMAFDEMSIEYCVSYDSKHQRIYGPNKKMLLVAIRGLFDSWKQPAYFHFDNKLTKEVIFEIIKNVQEAGLNVVDSRHGTVNELMPMISIANSERLLPNTLNKNYTGRKMHLFLISLPTILLSCFGFGPFSFLYLLFSLSPLQAPGTSSNHTTSTKPFVSTTQPYSTTNENSSAPKNQDESL